MGHLHPDGRVERLVGYRHTDAGRILVGDWSAIPEARHGFNLLWGFAWRPITVSGATLDTNRLVDRGDGVLEHPHILGPELFVSDSLRQNVNGRPGRVCRIRFSADQHNAVPVVTEFIPDAHNAWDVVCSTDDVLYVSERRAHRIAAYDAYTGAYIRTVIETPEGNAYAYVNESDRPTGLQSITAIRAQACILPEGLFLQDGWLYFGSIVMGQVKRINLSTLDNPGGPTVEVAAEWTPVAKSEYCKIALSDGTFGPRGTIFISTWETDRLGAPWAFLPGGAQWNIVQVASTPVDRGKNTESTESIGYGTSCCVGAGRLVYAGADYGVVEFTQTQSGDQLIDEATYGEGKRQYELAGRRLTHGVAGYRQWQELDLPWGESAEIDYYLSKNGHTAP